MLVRTAGLAVLACLTAALALPARAQEFACRVTIDTQQLSSSPTDVAYLDELGRSVEQYINGRVWTEDRFDPDERIDCDVRMLFTASPSLNRFQATLSFLTRRPIYGTTQTSTVFSVSDQEWEFEYVNGTALIYDEQRFDPITTLLNFYANLALGYDYDTFSALGGTPYFERAREIAQFAQSQNGPGWTSFGTDRGRTPLVTQLLDPRYRVLRQAYYDLHFTALDHFVQDANPEPARASVLAALRGLRTLYDDVSKQYALEIFFQTKASEIVGMMERSNLANETFALLVGMDPAQQQVYNRLVN